jgi:hypothetical protein
MLNEPTLEKLKSLRLDAMAAAWLAQQKDPGAGHLDFDERFGLSVDVPGRRQRISSSARPTLSDQPATGPWPEIKVGSRIAPPRRTRAASHHGYGHRRPHLRLPGL